MALRSLSSFAFVRGSGARLRRVPGAGDVCGGGIAGGVGGGGEGFWNNFWQSGQKNPWFLETT